MGTTQAKLPTLLNRAEYRAWAETQTRGRVERVDGEIIAMSPERAGRARVKARAWQALDRALREARLP
ncbi:MAG: Uma2 family endonuclease [Acetobacteraceae bacterium]|nr:Uma2 family endonuclease [Acetobacteraceae bacterium]